MVGFCGLLQGAEITCTSAPSRLMTKPVMTEVSIQSTVCSEQKQCKEFKSEHNKQLMHLHCSQGVMCLLQESPGRVSLPAQL